MFAPSDIQNQDQMDPLHSPCCDSAKKLRAPSKLYGREEELETLTRAHGRVAVAAREDGGKSPTADTGGGPEVVLIAGPAGSGKSALVEQVRQRVHKDALPTGGGGFFVSGKFDQLRGRHPYSALVAAFSDLCDQILSRDSESFDEIQQQIKAAVGAEGRVLTDFLPSLVHVIGEQEDIPSLSGTQARNRFNYVFRKFLGALSRPSSPLILALDDLQWADESSLDLMTKIVTDSTNPSLLFLGIYRDNEISQGHPLAVKLREIERRDVPITRVQVRNLTKDVVNKLVADSFQLELQEAQSLSNIVYDLTDGNPFFVIHYMSYLCHEDLLVFSSEKKKWQ